LVEPDAEVATSHEPSTNAATAAIVIAVD